MGIGSLSHQALWGGMGGEESRVTRCRAVVADKGVPALGLDQVPRRTSAKATLKGSKGSEVETPGCRTSVKTFVLTATVGSFRSKTIAKEGPKARRQGQAAQIWCIWRHKILLVGRGLHPVLEKDGNAEPIQEPALQNGASNAEAPPSSRTTDGRAFYGASHLTAIVLRKKTSIPRSSTQTFLSTGSEIDEATSMVPYRN